MLIRVHQFFEGLSNQNLKGLLDGLLGLPSWPAQDADEPLLSPSVWRERDQKKTNKDQTK